MKWLFVLLALLSTDLAFSQKMLQMEKANRVRAIKFYTGDVLYFKLKGRENYWYEREITGILPEAKLIMLDLQPTHIDSIAAIKLSKPRFVRVLGTAFMSFGITLSIATGYAALNGDKPRSEILLPLAAVSLGGGMVMVKPRTYKMGKKNRLRLIEVPVIR